MMKQNIMVCAAALVATVAGLAISSGEAAAQGTLEPQQRGKRICPSDWVISSSVTGSGAGDVCRPRSNSSRRIYAVTNPNSCTSGYAFKDGWWVEQREASASAALASPSWAAGSPLAKANPLQLCPSGHMTTPGSKSCAPVANAPAARPKGAGACNAGEVEEFGAWCTSTTTTLTAKQIEGATIGDLNRIVQQNRNQMPIPRREGFYTPLLAMKQAEEGAAAPAQASASGNAGAASGVQQAAAATPAQADACAAKPKKKGLGRALGGAMGAALGAAVDAAEGC